MKNLYRLISIRTALAGLSMVALFLLSNPLSIFANEDSGYPSCPIEPKEGRIILDLNTNFIRSDKTESDATKGPFSTSISAGTYDVTLVSFDDHDNKPDQVQPNESWYLALKDSLGALILNTNAIGDLPQNENYKTEIVNTNLVLDQDVSSVTAFHNAYHDSKANSITPLCAAFDEVVEEEEEPSLKTATIVASKIVCENESDLPNWHQSTTDITASTASDFVSGNDNCRLEPNWKFQWGPSNATDPGESFLGEASSPWTTFASSTNSVGQTSVTVTIPDDKFVWIREVLKPDYLTFSSSGHDNLPGSDVSAEMWCDTDVVNYDNYDFVENIEDGETYHCVSFNVLTTIPSSGPSCPIEPKEGRILIDFGASGILANSTESNATKGPFSTSIPAGTYDVTFGSFDGHLVDHPGQFQPNESWYLKLKDSLGALILNTNAISDLPDDQDYLTEKVHTNLVLNEDVFSVTAFHDVYPSTTNPNSITPLCAAFDEVVEEEENGGGGGAPICPLPEITSSLSVSVAVDQAFSYTITATTTGITSTTTVFSVATSSLPDGLSFSTSTGAITGTPTETGTFEIPISVSNDCGTDSMTLVITVTSGTNGGGGGGGTTTTTTSGSGGGIGRSGDFNRGSSSGGGGVVLGATTDYQCSYLRDFLRMDFNNDPLEVLKLQSFLINFEGHTNLSLNGNFDQATFNAVSMFQTKYFNDILAPWGHTGPTGYVYILTRKKINEIYCQRAHPLTSSQIEEINTFRTWLQSVAGADSELFPGKTGSESDWEEDTSTTPTTSTTTSPILPLNNGEDCSICQTNKEQNFGNLVATVFTQPGNLLDTAKCLYWALLILLALYVLGSVLKNVFYENTPENDRKRFLVKGLTIDFGLILAFVLAYVFGWWCLLLPLLIVLIISLVWTVLYPEHNSMRASVKSWYLVGHARAKSILKKSIADNKQSDPAKNEYDKTVIALPEESKSKK